jgi:hypothetical protein
MLWLQIGNVDTSNSTRLSPIAFLVSTFSRLGREKAI